MNNCKTLGDLADMSKSDLVWILGVQNYEKLKDKLFLLSNPLSVITEDLLENSADSVDLDMYIRRYAGETLNEIGEAYGMTRERVRQICQKFEDKITPFMHGLAAIEIGKTGADYCTTADVLEIFDNDNYDKVIMLSLQNSDQYDYLDYAEVFVRKSKYPDVSECLLRIAEDVIGDGVDL